MKQIITIFLLLFSQCTSGQSNFCASQEVHNHLMITDSIYHQKYLQAQTIMLNANNNNGLLSNGIFYVPIVVHIIHTGDPIGTGTNPTDLQIQNYINTLNQGFSATFPSYPDTNNGGQNIKIQFQLAQRDPNCNSTNGIVRINASNDAAYVSGGLGVDSYIGGISYTAIANKSFWNSNDYVNLWVVKSINGGQYTGYGMFPQLGSFFGDGVYIDHADILYSTNPYLSAHELGHFFDLRHTFQGSSGSICPTNSNCLTDGDMVCDTDPTILAINTNGCSASNINPCTNAPYGNIINNYMNYNCYHTLFTPGQKARMINAISTLRSSLITSLGAQPPSIITPTISIGASTNNICQGTSVTFTASITNGGAPTYQWKVNGTNVGTNSNTYSYTPNNSDIVTCQLTSSASCANPSSVTSNSVTMSVINSVTPAISISASTNNICQGTSVTFTASITNGGAPTYQWKVNGTNVGTNSNTYSYTPNNSDIVTCQLTSSASCANPSSVTSNSVTMSVINSVTPAISISANTNNICQGTSVTFTASITNGGTPTYQWKVNGTNVGTNSNTYSYTPNNSDIVTCQLTSSASCANPTSVTSNSVTMSVINSVTPAISISASTNNICQGTSVTFTASITNGGAPTYQWKVNGTNVGTNSNTYSYTPNNSDIVTCQLTSSASCANPTSVTSNSVTMSVINSVTPAISISASTNNICQGTSVTFTASITNGGAPTYQWKVNGTNVGTNSNTYSYTPNNSDIVTCQLTSSASCANPSSVTSNSVTMSVINSVTPAISISANTNNICQGTSVTFTASITNGGTPTYQWKVNGTNVGTNSNTYSYTPNNSDIVTCQLTSSASCANPTSVTSNSVTMSVINSVTPAISISASTNNICQGTSVTFTASITNGGAPTYQWKVNGTNVGTNSNTYSYTPNNSDIVTCQLTSSASCANPTSVTSNSVTMSVINSVTPTISISASTNNICQGTSVTFTASITNGGTPTYQWKVNGTNVGTNSNTYSYTPNNSDIVTCQLTSSASCANPTSVISNAVGMNINPTLTPQISIQQLDSNICEGSAILCIANLLNVGSNPSLRWIINGDTIINSNFNPYPHNNCQLNDTIICEVTSNDTCSNPNLAYSLPIYAQVKTNPIPIPFKKPDNNFKVINYPYQSCNCSITWTHIGSFTTWQQVDTTFFPPWYGEYFCTILFDGCSTQSIDTLSFYPLSINNTSINNEVLIYPNPSQDGKYIISSNIDMSKTRIFIYAINGQLLESHNYSSILDISYYSKGIYYLKIISEKTSIVKKIKFE